MTPHVAPEPNVPNVPAAPEANVAAPAPRKAGRPIKHVVPTDGSPVPPEVMKALRDREHKRALYQANPEQICARNYRSLAARQAKARDAQRQLEELKRTLAALVAGEPVALVLPQLRAAAGV